MEYTELGGTGVEISRVGLGCGNFGGIGSSPQFFGAGETKEEAFALLDAAFELGVTLLDTADAYGGGRSERWIGEWVAARAVRERVVLSTKVFHSVEGDPEDRGLAPTRIRRQIEASLERLGVTEVDLYLIHEPDPATPIAATLEALDGLVRSGKVGAIGASNMDGEQLEEALAVCADRGLARFEWVQNSYSLLERAAEREVLPICERHGLGFTPFSPLAGGWLTGKYRRGEAAPAGSRMTLRPEPYAGFEREETFEALDVLARAAEARGVDSATLSLAWLLADARVTSVILGPRRPSQLDPARQALELRLSEAEREELGALFPLGARRRR